MGGTRSGRYGRYVSIEGTRSRIFSVQSFNRAKLPLGVDGTADMPWADGFTVETEIHTGDDPHIRLKHRTNDAAEEPIDYRVSLLWTVPPYGGLRWWFRCPKTYRRCCKLYLPLGGRRFLSRQAYKLRYACQVETRHSRLMRQCRKINRKLGGDGDDDWIPGRPKWMRARTYDRLAARMDEYGAEQEAEANRILGGALIRLTRGTRVLSGSKGSAAKVAMGSKR